MEDSNLHKYETALQRKARELSETLRDRSRIAIEPTAEACEGMVMAANREIGVLTLDLDSRLAREVQEALARLRDGSYGICQTCDEPIKPRRLDAVPWARHCVHCQEMLEQDQIPESAEADFRPLMAA